MQTNLAGTLRHNVCANKFMRLAAVYKDIAAAL